MHFRSLAVFASGKQFALPALPDGESGLLFRFPASTCVTQCDPGHRLSSHLESRRLVANRWRWIDGWKSLWLAFRRLYAIDV